LKTSLAGGAVWINYDAPAAVAICGVTCDPDTSFWNIGSRTQWSPVPNFSLAVDVMYTHIDSANPGFAAAVINGRTATVGDADIWTGMVRVRRDFVP
jgi:Porin subfamily